MATFSPLDQKTLILRGAPKKSGIAVLSLVLLVGFSVTGGNAEQNENSEKSN
jgi:hypothetical protein